MNKKTIENYLNKMIILVIILFPYLLIKNSSALKTLEHLLFIGVIIRTVLIRKIYINKNIKRILILLFIMFGSIFLSLQPNGNDSLTIIRYMIVYFGLMLALTQIELTEKILKWINFSFFISSFLLLIFSWYKFYEIKFVLTKRFSAGFDIFIFGYIVSVFILFNFMENIKDKEIKPIKILNLLLILGYIPLLIANGSRMNWISLTLLFIIIWILNFNLKKILVIIVTVLVTGVLIPNKKENFKQVETRIKSIISITNSSNAVRADIFKNSLNIYIKHPFIGGGFRNYKNNSIELNKEEKYFEYFDFEAKKIKKWPKNSELRNKVYAYFYHVHSHNNFLEMLRGTGIIGAISYILIFIFIGIELFQRWVKNKKNKWLELALIMVVFLQLTGLTDTTLHMRRINEIVLFFVGIGLSKTFDKKEIIKEEENHDKENQV